MPWVDHIRVGFVDAECRNWPVDTQWGKGARVLADYLWKASVDGRLDLVLGIVPSGASYLLLPRAWTGAWNRRVGGPSFFARTSKAKEYLSLSPISFLEHQDLFNKLKSYEQNAKKKKSNPGIADSSKANQRYSMSRAPLEKGEVDISYVRADFEHSRLLFALLRARTSESQQLPLSFRQPYADHATLSSDAYATHLRSALSRARVVALSYSTITAGTEEDTQILDIGWCDVSIQSFCAQNAVNYMFKDQMMKVPQQRYRHDSVVSESLPSDVIVSKLQGIIQLARPESPLILLVHGTKNTCTLLDKLGFRTDSWYDGIGGILYKEGLKQEQRSDIPHREGGKHLSLPPRTSAVYMLDVEALFNCATKSAVALKGSTNLLRIKRILESAARFNLDVQGREYQELSDPQNPKSPMISKYQYNAGLDTILIAETWLAMSDGPDIDELSTMLTQDIIRGPTIDDSPSPGPAAHNEIDDDDNPNIGPLASGPRVPPRTSGSGITDWYDEHLSDEGDF